MFPVIWYLAIRSRRTASFRRHSRAASARSCHLQVEGLERRDLLSGTNAAAAQLQAAYGQIPLSFEANQGQTDPQVRYLAHGAGYTLFLTPTEAVLSLQSPAPARPTGLATAATAEVLTMSLVGGNPATALRGEEPLAITSNYFLGADPRRWHDGIANYGRVASPQVYPGIDLAYYGNQQQLEYDFTVHAGASPDAITLAFQGAQSLALDGQGNLVLHTAGGDVAEHAPVLYQEGAGGRQAVAGRYVLEGNDRVGFQVGAYDRGRDLVIDPTLVYTTYLGGSGSDSAGGIAVDAAGEAFVVGMTASANFPTSPGAYQSKLGGSQNVFLAKLNPPGTALVYATFLGGNGNDRGVGVAVDAAGNAYVTGTTSSSNFPTTAGAFQTTLQGAYYSFVTKVNPTGTALVYSTLLGGSSMNADTSSAGITVDGAGNAYVTGFTRSTSFPTTPGAYQSQLAGVENAFVTKLNATGTALVYSTYLGGSASKIGALGTDDGYGIAVDAAGDAYVTGATTASNFPTTAGAFQTTIRGTYNGFVTKVNPGGTALVYSSYLGGSGAENGQGIAVDAAGNAYVTGSTSSTDFPTTSGALQRTLRTGSGDAFVTKLNPTGTALVYSTFLGGSGSSGRYSYGDSGQGIAVDAAGNVYVTGSTASNDFPTTSDAFQTAPKTPLAGTLTAFLAKLNPAGTALAYSTYLGGSGTMETGSGVAVDASGNAYVTGTTNARDFPTTAGAFQTTLAGSQNAFVAKLATKSGGTAKPGTLFAVGGAPGRVQVYMRDNTLVADFQPYGPSYTGPIAVAVGDITGDGYADLVTGALVGNPDVRVYDGKALGTGGFSNANPNASLLAQFFAYGLNFNVGATVAVGDVSGNGFADIITGASVGNPQVKVFRGKDIASHTFQPNGSSLLASFFAYGLNFNIGVNVAAGGISGNGFADIVTGPTAGNPQVKVFRGKDIAQQSFQPDGASLLASFFAYGLNFNVGANVAVGDVTGNGYGDIITGASAGNPQVKVFDGQAIVKHTFDNNQPDASLLDQFFAYGLSFNTGVTVAAADFESSGHADLLTGASGGAPHYRVVRANATGILPPAVFQGIPSDLQGGIDVGA